MRIILEGADLTGKSTLAKELANKLDLSYIHVVRKDLHTFSFYIHSMFKEDVVFDRHFIGEMIYPTLFNRKGNLDKDSFKAIYNNAIQLGYKIFICYEDEDELERRLRLNSNEPEDVKETLFEANRMFKHIAKQYNIQLIKVSDYLDEDKKDLTKFLNLLYGVGEANAIQ